MLNGGRFFRGVYMEQFAASSAHHHSLSLNTFKEQPKMHLFEKKPRTSSFAFVTFL